LELLTPQIKAELKSGNHLLRVCCALLLHAHSLTNLNQALLMSALDGGLD
jgi:hypothetical protein